MCKLFIRFIFCLLVIFQTHKLFAQNSAITDSTYLSLQKIKNDSVRTNKIITYASGLIVTRVPLGLKIANELIQQANEKKNKTTLGLAYMTFGYCYLQIGEYAKAYPYYLQALNIYKTINQPARLVRVYVDMTWIQVQLKEYEQGEISIQNAIKICRQHNLVDVEGGAYNMYGILNDSQQKFDKAIECYQHALLLGEKTGSVYTQTSALINLSGSQHNAKKYNEALASLLRAKKLADKANDIYSMQAVNQNLSALIIDMKDYDMAEKYIMEALANSKTNTEVLTQRGLYETLKSIYTIKHDYKTALAYADSVTKLGKKVFDREKVADIRDLQAKYDTKLKDEKILKQNALNLQQQQQLQINKKQLELTLEQKKNEQLSFTKRQLELENQKKLQQSVIQKDRLQARLDKQNADQQIFRQQEKLRTNSRLQLLFGLITLMALAISALIFYNQRKTKRLNQLVTEQKKDLENLNGVKDRIFSIIGHDMRSPVNTLISFNHLLEDSELSADKIKLYSREIKKTLTHTSVLMENLLNWSRSQMQGYKPDIKAIDLKGISEQVINTLSAQALQKGISIDNSIDTVTTVFADADMTELIMRNLISNAIKFTPNNGLIKLSTVQTQTDVTFCIKDTGNGMSNEQLMQFNSESNNYNTTSQPGTNKEKGTGLGLLLCKTFTGLMNGKIYASSEPGNGASFFITLPKAS